jgi:eukaryotic-like serine/threonine-protein kinase
MNERFFRCPHCPFPHAIGTTVCPTTDNTIRQRLTSSPSAPPRPLRAVAPAIRKVLPSTLTPAQVPIRRSEPPPKRRSTAPNAPDLVGSVIAERYDVVSVIGQGGMGTVFLANHRVLERPVAIKVLNALQAAKTTSVMRFHNEARTAGSIGHPNICEVYDLGTLPTGSPYLVMEYLSGETLAACIARTGQLDVLEAIDVIAHVLAGLSAAHAKGIVHRDIKPENILLVTEPRQTVKILDFGVSKMLGDDPYGEGEDVLSLTRTGMVMGTPYYMAAEQARGERDLDSRVDVYACGVMLYEALAGKRPYIAPNYNALLLQIVGKPASRLSQHRPNVPPRAEAIVAKAMERNRDKRYGTANEFRQALTSLREELAPKAPAKIRKARPVVPAYNIDDEDHHTLVRSEELFEVESSPTYIETERMHQEDFNPPSRKPRS